jgi:hypothetical protein
MSAKRLMLVPDDPGERRANFPLRVRAEGRERHEPAERGATWTRRAPAAGRPPIAVRVTQTSSNRPLVNGSAATSRRRTPAAGCGSAKRRESARELTPTDRPWRAPLDHRQRHVGARTARPDSERRLAARHRAATDVEDRRRRAHRLELSAIRARPPLQAAAASVAAARKMAAHGLGRVESLGTRRAGSAAIGNGSIAASADRDATGNGTCAAPGISAKRASGALGKPATGRRNAACRGRRHRCR